MAPIVAPNRKTFSQTVGRRRLTARKETAIGASVAVPRPEGSEASYRAGMTSLPPLAPLHSGVAGRPVAGHSDPGIADAADINPDVAYKETIMDKDVGSRRCQDRCRSGDRTI